MKYNILSNIRKNNLKTSIYAFIFGAGPTAGCIYYLFNDGLEAWFPILLFGGIGGLMIWFFIKSFNLVISPEKSDIFKKYGSLEKLEEIMEEIENSIEFEDKQIIVSKNYVADKKDFEKITAYKDILRVHKTVHKTNFVVDGYYVTITDKYNHETSYPYRVGEEATVDKLILLIGSKCENAKLGYTKEAEEHIKKNKQELPKDIIKEEVKKESTVEKNKEEYACPDCNNKIEVGDKFCKNCGCKIDWS